jgi:hypothetical protein
MNQSEILRTIDSLQLTAEYKVSTPVDWQKGDRCLLDPNLSADKANELFPIGYEIIKDIPSKRDYIRFTAQPNLVKSKQTTSKEPNKTLDSIERHENNVEFRRSRPSNYQTPPKSLKNLSVSTPSLSPTKAPINVKSQDHNFENNFEFLENPQKKKPSKLKIVLCNCC